MASAASTASSAAAPNPAPPAPPSAPPSAPRSASADAPGASTPPTASAAAAAAAATAADPEEARWRARIEAEPADIAAHVALSKTLLRAKRPAEAVEHLWPAVQATPQEQSAPLRFQLAMALALQEQHDVAEPLLLQVLELEPAFAEALLCLCATQQALGKLEQAAQTLERVAALRPELKEYCEREAAVLLGQAPGADGAPHQGSGRGG